MGTGQGHGRPEAAAAAAASAELVEAVRSGDALAFTAAVARWCDAVLGDHAGWALWLWRGHSGFELGGRGGRSEPPQSAVDAVTRSLQANELRAQLAAGHPVVLAPGAAGGGGPDAAAVAFGSPAGLLAVLAVFERGGRAVLDGDDMGVLASGARLCTAAVGASSQGGERSELQPGLLMDLRDALTAVVGFAHTLIRSEHRLGRVERRRYHAVIERQALALTGTVDEAAVVAGLPGEAAQPHVLTPGDRDAFAVELSARLGADADVTVGADVAGMLPTVADVRALALALAGLAVAVAPPGGTHVEVAAATSAALCRIGVVAAVGDDHAARLADLVDVVRSGAEGVAWSGRAALAIAAAVEVAHAHGGGVGCARGGGVVHVWIDLPVVPAAP